MWFCRQTDHVLSFWSMPGKTVFLDMVSYDNQHKIKKLTLQFFFKLPIVFFSSCLLVICVWTNLFWHIHVYQHIPTYTWILMSWKRVYTKKILVCFSDIWNFLWVFIIISVKLFLKCGYTSDYPSVINEKNVVKVLKNFARETLIFYILEVSILIW